MTLKEYNNALDEVEAIRAYGAAILDEAEQKRRKTITDARAFIKEKLGEDALVSMSAALYQIEASEGKNELPE